MLRVLADCGLRVGELFALRPAGLDLPGAMLTVAATAWEGEVTESSERQNHDREVPIPPSLVAMLGAVPPRVDTLWLSVAHRQALAVLELAPLGLAADMRGRTDRPDAARIPP